MSSSCIKFLMCVSHAAKRSTLRAYGWCSSTIHPFFVHLSYYTLLALLGTVAMLRIPPRDPTYSPVFVDMLYMTTSAASSGLVSVDIERFSERQLIVLTVILLLGGEVFVSVLGLFLRQLQPNLRKDASNPITDVVDSDPEVASRDSTIDLELARDDLIRRSTKYLGRVVSCYHLTFHVAGSLLVFLYFRCFSATAMDVLRSKGLNPETFAVFTVASSFANVGMIPTNESMMAFKKNPSLFLILIPQMLVGTTLFPVFLRTFLWFLRRIARRRRDSGTEELIEGIADKGVTKYYGLFTRRYTGFLTVTVVGFIVLQVVLFCSLDWGSEALAGLSSYEKLVGALFVSVNTRHAGEGSVDFSLVSPAVLILFIVMMYLPASTTFYPHRDGDESEEGSIRKMRRRSGGMALVTTANLSQISYITIFVVLICIIERQNMASDPINFSVLNIIFETVSAYGNVGLSMGYSCGRLLRADSSCTDGFYSFSGKWSDEAKLVLIFVMLFGKLKRFYTMGGRAWRLAPPTTKIMRMSKRILSSNTTPAGTQRSI